MFVGKARSESYSKALQRYYSTWLGSKFTPNINHFYKLFLCNFYEQNEFYDLSLFTLMFLHVTPEPRALRFAYLQTLD
jgi:hypothetical protein